LNLLSNLGVWRPMTKVLLFLLKRQKYPLQELVFTPFFRCYNTLIRLLAIWLAIPETRFFLFLWYWYLIFWIGPTVWYFLYWRAIIFFLLFYFKKGNLYCLAAQWKVALTRYLLKTTFWNYTQIHDLSCSWIGTGTSIKSGGVKLILWSQTSPLSEMMRSCKCFPRVSKMSTLTYNQVSNAIIKNTRISNTNIP
jgi:hypothetical protein